MGLSEYGIHHHWRGIAVDCFTYHCSAAVRTSEATDVDETRCDGTWNQCGTYQHFRSHTQTGKISFFDRQATGTQLSVLAYRMARKTPQSWRKPTTVNWAIERRVSSVDAYLPDTWSWGEKKPENMSEELVDFIATEIILLPDDVVRVDEINRIISIYWHERSDSDGVQQIAKFLDGCTRRPEVKADDDFEGDSSDVNDLS